MKKMFIVITLALFGGLNCYSPVLAAESKGTIDEVSGKLCAKCHRSKLKAPFVHGGLADRECSPCHTVTGGNHQNDHTIYGVKDKSSKVCYECHENKTAEKSVHPPIQENDCLGCHSPHTGNFRYQLSTTSDKLCFNCHELTLVSEKETTKNSFRDGTSNLHNVHVEKNAVPCLSCHDVHSSSQEHLVRPKGTNGKEAVTITYTITPKGGNCTVSCHDSLGYERK